MSSVCRCIKWDATALLLLYRCALLYASLQAIHLYRVANTVARAHALIYCVCLCAGPSRSQPPTPVNSSNNKSRRTPGKYPTRHRTPAGAAWYSAVRCAVIWCGVARRGSAFQCGAICGAARCITVRRLCGYRPVVRCDAHTRWALLGCVPPPPPQPPPPTAAQCALM